jgi:hypothetical protein
MVIEIPLVVLLPGRPDGLFAEAAVICQGASAAVLSRREMIAGAAEAMPAKRRMETSILTSAEVLDRRSGAVDLCCLRKKTGMIAYEIYCC